MELRKLYVANWLTAQQAERSNCFVLSEERGLVFVNSMTAKVGAVFYDRDPTWQNEIVSGTLAQEVCAQLVRTGAACLGFITLVALYVTAYPEPRLHLQSVARCTLAASKAALAKQGA